MGQASGKMKIPHFLIFFIVPIIVDIRINEVFAT